MLWFSSMAAVRTGLLCFDLFNVADATVDELLHRYVLVVAALAALNVKPQFVEWVKFGH
jgi:hypothetical protein